MLDAKIFDQVVYVSPSDNHNICPQYTDGEIIERIVREYEPMSIDETGVEYCQRINDEMNSYPLIGLIKADSVLGRAIENYDGSVNIIKFGWYDDDGNRVYSQFIGFLTSDTNYDVIDVDLFLGDSTGKEKEKFLKVS